MLESKVVDAYTDGSPVSFIANSFNISNEEVIGILISHKEASRFKRTFSDDFKKMIALRDTSGASRRSMAVELNLNASTIKKACEQFGQSCKDKSLSENMYTKIEGDFKMSRCPSCDSIKINEVDEKTTYCMDCGGEFIFEEDHVLKINWEYIEE